MHKPNCTRQDRQDPTRALRQNLWFLTILTVGGCEVITGINDRSVYSGDSSLSQGGSGAARGGGGAMQSGSGGIISTGAQGGTLPDATPDVSISGGSGGVAGAGGSGGLAGVTGGSGGAAGSGGTGGGGGAAGAGGAPITCTPDVPIQVSASTATASPTLGYAGGYWGVAWLGPVSATIQYNSINSVGMRNAVDTVAVPAVTNVTYSEPVLAPFGSELVLAAAQKGPSSNTTFTMVRRIQPSNATIVGSQATGPSQPSSTILSVEGLATDPSATRIAVASRISGVVATAATLDRFTAAPAYASPSAAIPSSAYAVSVGWSETATRFGAPYIVSGTSTGGKFSTYDALLSIPPVTTDFTVIPDQPLSGSTSFPVSVAPMGSQLVVAWLAQAPSTFEVFLTSLDPVTGARSASVQASDTAATYKYYPRVISDGNSLFVVWVENAGVQYRAMWRRFDNSLSPLGPSVCASCPSGQSVPLGRLGAASAARNQYGVAMLLSDNLEYVARITCTGP